MTIAQYQDLTGITVATADQARYNAQIVRTRQILESMLGFSLLKSKTSENLYEELGKSALDYKIPADDADLLPPDTVTGAYRLYGYNEHDAFFHVDPFTQLNSVKLVFIRMGGEPNGITIKTFESDEMRVQKGMGGISKFIQKCEDCFDLVVCECKECVQLAVDADWLYDSCLPQDINYIWADMVTYYADCKKDIKSETLGTHQYTKFDNQKPEDTDSNRAILTKYAGPYGSLTREATI